jgi:chromosome segregation ATPase
MDGAQLLGQQPDSQTGLAEHWPDGSKHCNTKPMKTIYVQIVVSLALLVGCAKNSDIGTLQSQLKKLQDGQSEVTTDLRNQLDLTQAKLADLQREVERMKTSESELADAAKFEREMDSDAAKETSDVSKEILGLDGRLLKIETDLEAIGPSLDAKASELDVSNLKDELDVAERSNADLKDRVDNIVAILNAHPGPDRQGLIDALR